MLLPRTNSKRSKAAFAAWVVLALVASVGVFFVISAELGDAYGRGLPLVPTAMQTVNDSLAAKEQLGENIQMRWPIQVTDVSYSDGGDHATVTIPVRGSKEKGTLDIQAVERGNVWTTQKLSLKPSGSNKAVVLVSLTP